MSAYLLHEDDFEFALPQRRYRDWAFAVFCWDGMLPLAIAALTSLVVLVFRDNDVVTALFAVITPIAGFFIRLWIGGRHFDAHPHFAWQVGVFFVAVLLLVLLECVLILFQQLGNALSPEDWLILTLLYLPYFLLMALALFPFVKATTNQGE